MRRLDADEAWSLFDPADVRSLTNLVGDEFDAAYETYERQGLAVATVPARRIWDTVSAALRESGTPFLLFSGNINGRCPPPRTIGCTGSDLSFAQNETIRGTWVRSRHPICAQRLSSTLRLSRQPFARWQLYAFPVTFAATGLSTTTNSTE